MPGCSGYVTVFSSCTMASVQRVSTIDDDKLVKETALNGDYPETTATIDLSDSSEITRMEDMLRVATDLQDNSSHDTNRGININNERSKLLCLDVSVTLLQFVCV